MGHVYWPWETRRIVAQGGQGGQDGTTNNANGTGMADTPELLLRASLMLSSKRAEASFDSCSCLSVAFLPGVKLE